MLARPIALFVSAVLVAGSLLVAAAATAPPEPGPTLGRRASLARPVASGPGSAPAPGERQSAAPLPPGGGAASGPDEDLMTYAFAHVDVAALGERLVAVAEEAAEMGGAASGGGLAATREIAGRLSGLAEEMTGYAAAAAARMEARRPGDESLQRIRTDALAIYESLHARADAAATLADFALSLDPAAGADAARTIADLESARADLEAARLSLADALESWASTHRSDADQALERFGVPAR